MAKNTPNEFDADIQEEDAAAMFENNEDGLTIDLSGVEAMTFDAIPAGIYQGRIEEVTYSLSKSSNKPLWSVKLGITDEGAHQNRKIFTFLSFSPKATPGTKAAMLTFAPELCSTPFRVDDPEILAGLSGRKFKVRTGLEKYNGEDQTRVKKWIIPDQGGADGFIEE